MGLRASRHSFLTFTNRTIMTRATKIQGAEVLYSHHHSHHCHDRSCHKAHCDWCEKCLDSELLFEDKSTAVVNKNAGVRQMKEMQEGPVLLHFANCEGLNFDLDHHVVVLERTTFHAHQVCARRSKVSMKYCFPSKLPH